MYRPNTERDGTEDEYCSLLFELHRSWTSLQIGSDLFQRLGTPKHLLQISRSLATGTFTNTKRGPLRPARTADRRPFRSMPFRCVEHRCGSGEVLEGPSVLGRFRWKPIMQE